MEGLHLVFFANKLEKISIDVCTVSLAKPDFESKLFRYLYIDLYPDGIWSGTENPENSRNFTSSKIPYRCAHDSIAEGVMPAIGYVSSLGEDNRKDIHMLTTTGVYRVTRPSRCNYHCPKERTVSSTPSPHVSLSRKLWERAEHYALLISSMLLLFLNLV